MYFARAYCIFAASLFFSCADADVPKAASDAGVGAEADVSPSDVDIAPELPGAADVSDIGGTTDVPSRGSDTASATLFEAVGGSPAVISFVTDFSARLRSDVKVNGYFLNTSVDLERFETCLTQQVEALLDAPNASYPDPGEGPNADGCRDMVSAHAGMGISTADYDDVVAHAASAMAKAEWPPAVRAAAGTAIEAMRAQIVEDEAGDQTLYQRVGRRPAISGFVADVIQKVLLNPEINGFFASTSSGRLSTCLIRQLCAIDGPCKYGEGTEPVLSGIPCRQMGESHEGLADEDGSPLSRQDFDAFVSAFANVMNAPKWSDKFGNEADVLSVELEALCPQILGSEEACATTVDGTDAGDGTDMLDNADGADGMDANDGVDGTDAMDGADTTDGTDGSDTMDGTDGTDSTDGGVPILRIDEVDYEQAGLDTMEFIEIYNAGTGSASLDTAVIEISNSSGDLVGNPISLAEAASLPAGGYLVLGTPSLLSLVPSGTATVVQSPGFSGFLPGATGSRVRLLVDGAIVSEVVYAPEGGSIDEGLGSWSRCPGPTENVAVVHSLTPGKANLCDVSFAEVNAVFAARCYPCHTSNSSGGHAIGGADLGASYADAITASYGDVNLTKAQQSLVRVQDGTMPNPNSMCTGDPVLDVGGAKCFTLAEQGLLMQWIATGQAPPAM